MISKVLQPFNKVLSDNGIEKKGIIQIGAFDGEEVSSYLEMGFDPIMLVEANPDNIPKLHKSVDHHEANIRIYPVAITNYDGMANFNIPERADCGSIYNYTGLKTVFGIQTLRTVEVPCFTVDTLMKEYNEDPALYNVLNMDIEGGELDALKGATELLKHINVIYSEIRFADLFENGTMCEDLEEFVFKLGFKKVFYKKWHETFGDAIYIR